MPEHPAVTEHAVGLMRCVGLPRLDDPIERIVGAGLNNHVHMIGHDAPRQKAITLAIEMKQRRLDKPCDVRSAEPTRTSSGIKLFVRLGKIVGERSEGLGDSSREAVAQAEGHELDGLR